MMKRKAFNRLLSLLLSAALLVTSVCATVSATALSALEDAPFTAYYSSNMQDAADGKTEFGNVSLSTDWKLNGDGTMLVRKDKGSKGWNQDVVKNMSVLYYNVKRYKNFDMTVTYKTSADLNDWVAFFGFGGEMGKSWLANSSDTAFIIHEGGLLLNAKNSSWYPGDAVSGKVSNWVNGSVHTLRLKVFQGGFTVWIDGCQFTSGSNESYTDGYIWFAANATDVAFGIPEVTELVDTSVFSAYFSSNMSTREEVSPASLGTQWSLNETNDRLQRNLAFNGDESINDWGAGTAQSMSVLYYNIKSYKRFDMTVNYRTIENIGDQIAFAGFGAKIGKSWNYNASDNAFVLRADGSLANAKNNSVITANGMTAQDQTIASGKQWSAGGVHKLRILVEGDKYTAWIDGFEVASSELKDYDGGYIYFAANAGTVLFLKI